MRTTFAIKPTTANPNLEPQCDISVALVLDESYSIHQKGESAVRAVPSAFVNGLVDIGAKNSAMVEFNFHHLNRDVRPRRLAGLRQEDWHVVVATSA